MTTTATSSTAGLWYLAYGAMMNPVSLAARNIHPTHSFPCKVPNYQVIFTGALGMATLIKAADVVNRHSQQRNNTSNIDVNNGDGSTRLKHRDVPSTTTSAQKNTRTTATADDTVTCECCHGVVHRISEDEMARLAEIETTYATEQVAVYPYTPVTPTTTSTSTAAAVAANYTANNIVQKASSSTFNSVEALPSSIMCNVFVMSKQFFTPSPAVLTGPGTENNRNGVNLTNCSAAVPNNTTVTTNTTTTTWQLPSERYLDVCALGASYFGVDPQYVQWLRAQRCRPRKHPAQFRTVESFMKEQNKKKETASNSGVGDSAAPVMIMPAAALKFNKLVVKFPHYSISAEVLLLNSQRLLTLEQFHQLANEVQRQAEIQHENVSLVLMNYKVVLIAFSTEVDNPKSKRSFFTHGQDVTVRIALNIYEPKYGRMKTSVEAMSSEHRQWTEDFFVELLESVRATAVVVGSTSPSSPSPNL